ncbi:hypothetical protein EF847_21630 [Actinobacteria bacterium YIM 96077]|uniref:Glycosyltransferase RgtA/B/C/D-like domain-containing protein n=1 Tax=Phytoactinopolyspora halophila TaxID=1981511 RepID=A0A329QSQ4_9ACTN|nr:hypothetical protein [Phytoactinopolyspora halophila]AYY14897.1 hypothetical protein EF847_21630 [Actinobacteria bacterium YIM 96077]RAW15355.1 hypothetical protein DPM12_08860 [Phytoactinopolyspora halophila]
MLSRASGTASRNEVANERVMRWAPTALGVVAGLVLVVLAGQAFLGAAQIGISTDEPVHQARMNQWFANGWYLPPYFFDHGVIDPAIATGRKHSYGAAFGIFGHVAAVITGAESWGTTEPTAAAYTARGFALVTLGLLGALAVGYALLVTTGRWVIGAWAAAATFAIPLWVGYSMFAVKDIPVATGWTLVTTGMIIALVPTTRRLRPVTVTLLCFAGVWFSFGARTALWIPLAASAITFAFLVGCSPFRQRIATSVRGVAIGLASGLVAVAILHYRNVATPVEWLVSAVWTAGDFHWTGTTLTAGQLVSEKPPWWYIPAWLGGSTPLLVLLLSIIGTILVARLVLRRQHHTTGALSDRLSHPHAGMLLWVQQALLLPAVSTIGDATMYAGLRQHLYIVPALAAVAGFGAYCIVQRFGRGWPSAAVTVLLILAIAVPAWEQSRLFPYNFVYKNVAAGPVNDRWETDMHWVSAREALARVPSDESVRCYTNAVVQPPDDVVEASVHWCDEDDQVRAFLDEQGSDGTPERAPGQAWVIARKYRGTPPAEGCVEHDNITRPLRGENVVISYVLTCEPAALQE